MTRWVMGVAVLLALMAGALWLAWGGVHALGTLPPVSVNGQTLFHGVDFGSLASAEQWLVVALLAGVLLLATVVLPLALMLVLLLVLLVVLAAVGLPLLLAAAALALLLSPLWLLWVLLT